MHDWNSEIVTRLRQARLRPEDELEIIEELSAHLDDLFSDLRARGISPEVARRMAIDELLDGTELARLVTAARPARIATALPIGLQVGSAFTGMWSDVKLGARLLRRSPVFALMAVMTIALALAANTAVFSAIRSLLLRPLPYHEPDELAFVQLTSAREGEATIDTLTRWSWPKYADLVRSQRAFAELAGYSAEDIAIFNGATAERALVELATPSYFPVLGITPVLGRWFNATEDARVGNAPVAVLSHRMWLQRFAGDPAVIGRTLDINRQIFTIIGVAPSGFAGLSGTAVAWLPIAMAPALVYPEIMEERGNHWFTVVARRRADSTGAAEDAALANAYRVMSEGSGGDAIGAIISVPLDSRRVTPAMRRAVLVLFGGAALVLLIACSNIASLLIARSTARQQEIAVRLALGAGRLRLIRQLVAESMVLAVAGGAAGIALAYAGTRALRSMAPALLGDGDGTLLAIEPARIDSGVLVFTAAAILFTGLFAGLLPALHASRTNLNGALRDGTAGAGRGRGHARTRSVLVVVQTAVAVVLLVAAGLLMRTFAHYRAIPTGVDAENVITMRLAPLESDGYTPARSAELYRNVTERIATVPGVRASSVDRCLPLSGSCSMTVATAAGLRTFELGRAPEVNIHFIMPGHLDALGMRLLKGRMFTDADRDGAPKVVLLSESAARHLFGDADPIGQRIKLATAYLQDDASAEVVGVASDVRYGAISEPPGRSVYAPALQLASRSMYVIVRTTGEPDAVARTLRTAVQEVAPGVPITKFQTMKQHFGDVIARTRLMAVLLAGFAAFALALAMVGVFGVIAFNVEQRRAEIGLRLALGAEPNAVAGRIAGHGLVWFGAGMMLGLIAAVAASKSLQGLLYDVQPTDTATYVAVLFTLAVAGIIGAWIPARRAAAVSPSETLRSQ